ncbi:radical SAM protein [Elusimicrobiota bacterium]
MLKKFEPFQAKNVLQKIENEDMLSPARYTLNPYRGCAVGCRYCYVQQKKYTDSSGLEAEKDHVVQVKINAPFLLKKKLETEIDKGLIVIGESCEAFSDAEDEYFITQRLLEVLKEYNFPVHIITRFPRVVRDIQILRQINTKNSVYVTVSIPVISKRLTEKLEGKSPPVRERLKTISMMRKNDICTGVAISPVIPYISDDKELKKVLKKAWEYGAMYVLFSPLIIKEYQKDMFFSWLSSKYPKLVNKYEKLYLDRELPDKFYWDNFSNDINNVVSELGMEVGLPYDNGQMQQELLKINNYGRI